MSSKSQFLNSAKLAIAGVVLASSLVACSAKSEKHSCKTQDAVKAEKAKCSTAQKDKVACAAKVEAKKEKRSFVK